MGVILDKLREGKDTMTFDRNVTYWLPRELSVTFGTIFDNVRKWIKHDLQGVVEFKHEYVDTQLAGDKGFFWTSGLLGQARRPVLALQFNVDHLYEHPAYGQGYTFSAKESMLYMNRKDALFRVMAFEDEKDIKNNLEIRIAFKNVHINCHAGIVEVSRPAINNIAHYWHTVRQPNDQIYHFPHYVDFQIPTEVMNMLAERFHLDKTNHHSVLKFLNHNSFVNVFYGMSGYDGKFYYFLRYPVKSFIKTEGMTNPEPWAEEGIANPEVYTIERDFSVDVLVPMYMSFTCYGDRVVLEDPKYDGSEEWRDINMEEAAGSIHERFIEIEKVFKEKHEIARYRFNWTKDDLMKHKSGTITTKKIDLTPFLNLENDEKMKAFVDWAKGKGYNYVDIFNFQLYQDPGLGNKNIEKNDPHRPVIESMEDEQLYAFIPKDNNEYKYYLKNMEDFFIVDFAPDTERDLIMVVYCSLAIYNQYQSETKSEGRKSFANDDLGYDTGFGHSNFNETNNKV